MELAVFGAGYVGLVTAACLAEAGHRVHVVDVDLARIESLRRNECPILEPGLPGLLHDGVRDGRLYFTTDPDIAGACEGVFLALPTPARPDGSCDTSALISVVTQIAPTLREGTVVIVKSTVTVGTTDRIQVVLDEGATGAVHVAVNPEFLREGSAVLDFQVPDRVVIGARRPEALQLAVDLFAPFVDDERPMLTMDPNSAELCKYAANAFLAMRITYVNEIAALTDALDADIDAVRRAVGADSRIGGRYFYPGPGYGGACLPKDVPALAWMAHQAGRPSQLVDATIGANAAQRLQIVDRILAGIEDVAEPRVCVWGLSFKAHTTDCRESIAVDVIRAVKARGAQVSVHDPAVSPPDLGPVADLVDSFERDALHAAKGADVLALLTEWPAFRAVSPSALATAMRGRWVVDARNLLSPKAVRAAGLEYVGVGRRLRA